MTLPTVMLSTGLQPQAPQDLRNQLVAATAAINPGYTANLPGSLVEDIASTDTNALVLIDAARVETVNSLTPYGANAFVLNQLGQIYGVQLGQPTNTSVYVVFTGTPGFVIAQGFVVSDGTYQYVVQDGGVVGAGGTSPALFCVATVAGSWAVATNTVTALVTSVPSTVTLSVTNQTAGTPGVAAQTEESYRAAVLQAGLATSNGMPATLRTLLGNVPGVQARLVSFLQQTGGGWEIIVGGGDPYQVAYAIYSALFDVSTLVGSTLAITGITQANPGVVTTNLNHGYATGQVVHINGVVGMTAVNGGSFTITVLTQTTFSLGVNTTSYGAYVSGGVVTPNLRNVVVSINDYPDTYNIPFVNPPQQSVTMTVTWNTTAINFVSQAAVAQLAAPALIAYVNALPVGTPINLFELQTTFQNAVASILPAQLITRMVFAVNINGISVPPASGTGIIAGDPESYFYAAPTAITVTQG
jgi:hypothetical protein